MDKKQKVSTKPITNSYMGHTALVNGKTSFGYVDFCDYILRLSVTPSWP